MGINIIVALGRDRAIGRGGDLIWHLREDLKHFKQTTMGHAIVMGRRTWESLPKGALPGRTNIVISRQPGFNAPGAVVCSSFEEAMNEAYKVDTDPFIIGGGQIYALAVGMATRLYLTEVDGVFDDADTFFPLFDLTEWNLVESSEYAADKSSGLRYRFVTFERKCDEGCHHQ